MKCFIWYYATDSCFLLSFFTIERRKEVICNCKKKFGANPQTPGNHMKMKIMSSCCLLFVAVILGGCATLAMPAVQAAYGAAVVGKAVTGGIMGSESTPGTPTKKQYYLSAGDPYEASLSILKGRDPKAKIDITQGTGHVTSRVGMRGKNRLIRTEFRSGTLYRIVDAKTEEVLEPPKNPAPSP